MCFFLGQCFALCNFQVSNGFLFKLLNTYLGDNSRLARSEIFANYYCDLKKKTIGVEFFINIILVLLVITIKCSN